MAKNAVELLLKLKSDTKGLKGATNALNKLDKSLDKTSKSASGATAAFANIGKTGAKAIGGFAAAAGIAAGAVASVVHQVNQMNLELRRNVALSGTTIETFQKFAQIGEGAGVSVEHTADALNNLNLKITEWASLAGGAGGDVLKKLGLDATELSKIQDSGQQMIIFLDKLGKSSKNVQRLFADELGSDAFIYLAEAAKEAGNLEEAFQKIQDTGSIVSQEESDELIEYNKKMVELKNLIKKVGVQAVVTFEKELVGSLNSASIAFQKLIKDIKDPFGNVAKSIAVLDGVIESVVGGLKLTKDGLDLVLYSGDTKDPRFTKNFEEAKDSLDQLSKGLKQTLYSDFTLAEKELSKLSNLLKDFNVGDLLAQGFNEEQINAEWQKLAKTSLESVTQMQEVVKNYPPVIQQAMTSLLDKMITDVKAANEKVKAEIANTNFDVEPKIDPEKMATDLINNADIAIRMAQAEIDFIDIQFKAGTIDLETFKKQTKEQIDIQNEALKEASKNSLGIDQLNYKKRLEQNKIFAKKVAEQEVAVSKAEQNQIKANDEIKKQQIEILESKGKYIEALREQEKLEIEQLMRRKGLTDLDKAEQAINIGELYDFKEAEVEAEKVAAKIETLLGDLVGKEGAEQISILGDLDIEINKLSNLETAYGGLNKNVEEFLKERNEIVKDTLKTEDEIREASNLVLQSKLQVLNAEGEIDKAKSLQLQMTVAEINANKNLTSEQRTQLAQDAIRIANLEKQEVQTRKIAEYNRQVASNMLEIYRAQGKTSEATSLELKLQIQRINENKAYTAEQKTQLAQDAIKLANIQKQNDLEESLKYNLDTIAQKEIELLGIQGQKSEVLKKQFALTEEQINGNSRLTAETKKQVLEIEKQKLAYSQARLEVEKIESQIELILEKMNETEDIDQYLKLASSMEPYLEKLRELEGQYENLKTKENEFTEQAIEGAKSLELSVEQAAAFYADSFVDTFSQVIDGTKSVSDAFRDMLSSIVQELLKSNIQKLLAGLFNEGGALSGGSGIFTSIAGLFTGAALHTGGIAGRDGFARNAPISFAQMLPKYHTGGIAGAKPNEVPAMLEIGEEVLTKRDPRHRDNGGTSSNQVKIINELNTEETAKELGNTRAMRDAIRNEIRTNPSEYKSYLS